MPHEPMAAPAATPQEVKHLTAFIDGEIQVPEVRHHLRRSWGLCNLHTWLEAVVECELRARPFGTAILYEDLVRRASGALAPRHLPPAVRLRRLRPKASCLTCDYLQIAHGADHAYDRRVARVNARRRFIELVGAAQDQWRPASCPDCLGGAGPRCRPHLLAGAEGSFDEVVGALGPLAERLARLVRSMTWSGGPAAARVRSAWVEALGWFAGWQFPEAVLDLGTGNGRSASTGRGSQ